MMDEVLIAVFVYLSLSVSMICVAVIGYFMAQMWVELWKSEAKFNAAYQKVRDDDP